MRIAITTGSTVSLAKWIIDDTHWSIGLRMAASSGRSTGATPRTTGASSSSARSTGAGSSASSASATSATTSARASSASSSARAVLGASGASAEASHTFDEDEESSDDTSIFENKAGLADDMRLV